MADVAIEKRLHSPHSNLDKKDSAYKRSNKPYMEKKRRARINSCLTQLKTLVLQAMRKDTNQYSKLEKADILEMTVKHLRQLQRQQVSHAMSHDPSVVTKYKAGFTECANEVMRYLSSVQNIDEDVRGRLVNHLGNAVTQIHTPAVEQQQCAQPLNVQIPHQLNQGLASVQTGCLLMPAGVQTSPLVIQQQVQNIPNVYNHGHNNQSLTLTHQHQGQQAQQRLVGGNGTQFSGSFHIVPTSSSPNAAAVAVYLGQTQHVPPQSVQTSSPPAQKSVSCAPYPTNTPPRTKASLKSYDTSAFTQVSSSFSDSSNNSSPSCSPSSTEMAYMKTNLDLHMHGIALNCGRTPSPLKVEDVWRPW